MGLIHIEMFATLDLVSNGRVDFGTGESASRSELEGFGIPVLEAMACGAPVVTSRVSALPEVVGDAGVIVPPTVTAVTEALRRVLGDPDLALRLSTAGVQRARGFTWERTAAGWLEVLRSAYGAP